MDQPIIFDDDDVQCTALLLFNQILGLPEEKLYP